MNETSHREDGRTTDIANTFRRIALVLLVCFYSVMWIGGVAQHWLKGGATPNQSWLAAIFLMLAGMIVLVSTRSWEECRALFAVALFGYAAEVAGVQLNYPFGAYSYTDALGPKLLGVPLVMTFAWMTLAAYVKQMLLRFNLTPLIETIVAAIWLTAIDLVIDPLAANQLGYWHWSERGIYFGIPFTNFAGWFIVSLLAFQILRKRFAPNLSARLTGISVVLFFTLLAFALGSTGVALIGGALCSVHLLFSDVMGWWRAGLKR